MALLMTLRRMGRADLTVIEKALAHMIGNKAEQAYERGDLFQKRRTLMDAWAMFCGRAEEQGTVVKFPQAV
jgi:hypothetical protein